jgi:hypothetical protein
MAFKNIKIFEDWNLINNNDEYNDIVTYIRIYFDIQFLSPHLENIW